MKQTDMVDLINALQRAKELKNWAYNEWRLVELNGQKTETYNAASKFSPKPRWKERPHPVFAAAQAREKDYKYTELVELEKRVSTFASSLTKYTELPGANITMAKNAFREMNMIMRKADELKKLNAKASISELLSELDEAISLADESLAGNGATAQVNNVAPSSPMAPQAAAAAPMQQSMVATAPMQRVAAPVQNAVDAPLQAAQTAQNPALANVANPQNKGLNTGLLVALSVVVVVVGAIVFVVVRRKN